MIGTKLYSLLLLLAYSAWAVFYPRPLSFADRMRKVLLPFAAGVFIGLAPVYYYLLGYPRQFMFENLWYHFARAEFLRVNELNPWTTPARKLRSPSKS